MKKHRISKRIFAMLLVVCMVFTMLPVDASAANVKGDIVAGDMGMTNIDYTDSISWPIEIYDYSNDGMLFEYASKTGNTASWAQLDKDGEYCYMPELEADYYADYTTDEINSSQVVRRWFDVYGWNSTASQLTDSVSGLKYYKFQSFDGNHAELIDFRDPDSDDVIEWKGETIQYYSNPEKTEVSTSAFEDAYGYTFYIDGVDSAIVGGDARIITTASAYAGANPYYARIIVLAPVEGQTNQYSVSFAESGDGASTGTLDEDNITVEWDNGNLVLLVHGDGNQNWMDRRAANALKEGDIVTVSENKQFVTVLAPENSTASGTVSTEEVQYATLVYRTPENVEYTTETGYITNSNHYTYTLGTSEIYVFTSDNDWQTPKGIAAGVDYNWYKSIVLELTDSDNNTWQVVECDLNYTDEVNTASWSPIGTSRMVIMYRPEAENSYEASYNFFENNAKVGQIFTLTGTTLETLQSHTADYGTTLTDVYFACNVPSEVNGTMVAYLRATGSETLYASESESVPLCGQNATSDWRYCVFDLSNVTSTDDIQSAGIFLSAKESADYDLEITHFALFKSEAEAEVYGENALVYNKHHLQTIYPEYATYSTDFTTSEVANTTTLASYWWEKVYNMTENAENDGYLISYDDNGRQHYRFTGSLLQQYPEIELIDFNSIGGVEREKLAYAVLVCRTTDVGLNSNISLYYRNASGTNADGTASPGGKVISETSITLQNDTAFTALKYDLTEDITSFAEGQKVYSAGLSMVNYESEGYLDGSYYFDIRQFAFFETAEEADAYIEQIQEYNSYSGVPTSYYNPLYDNMGYGLLTQTREDASTHDKYELQLGYKEGATTHASATDGIYRMDSTTTTGEIALEDYTFDGYTLLGTLTEGSLTAGLLEGSLDEEGNPVYREQVIDYLAKLLETTLVIPEYEGGYFNYDFIRGEEREEYGTVSGECIDLATALRRCVGIDFEKRDTEVNKEAVVINGETYEIDAKVTVNGTTYVAGVLAAMEKGDKLIGAWKDCREYITNCYDAAYYLLHNLFVANSYNEEQNTYEYLTLYNATLTDGKPAYVFDAGLSKADGTTALNYSGNTISYETAAQKALYYTSSDVTDTDGNVTYAGTTTTLYPFLPVTEDNTEEGMTKSPYFADMGVGYDGLNGETYYQRDFNYVIRSHGEFSYHEDDGLFFEFEGDDDVYLFINGQLVLDIGGAHSITKERIDIYDYVEAAYATLEEDPDNERAQALALEEGQVCTFDFFYMERHGYGANCRIATNLRVTDPHVGVDKTAYQEDVEINYGGIVDAEQSVEYRFSLTNTGNTKLYNLSFKDEKIGVTLDTINGLTVTGTSVYDSSGDKLEADDLTAIVTGYKEETNGTANYIKNADNTMTEVGVGDGTHVATENVVTFKDNDALISFLKTLDDGEGGLEDEGSDDVQTGAGDGLWINSCVVIKGIYYKLTESDLEEGRFDNVLNVEATKTREVTDDTVTSSDKHRVCVPSEPYYYQWSGHDIVITKERLVADVIANSGEGDTFEGKVDGLTANNISSIVETSYLGRPITTSTVKIDNDEKAVTVNYNDTGTHVFYLTVYYDSGAKSVLVPVAVNVTDVEDSYIVLDYGLPVTLTEDNEVFKYDTVTVPGKDVAEHVLGIASEESEPAYVTSYDSVAGDHRLTVTSHTENGDLLGTDGTFNLSGATHEHELTYTPNAFMDEMDTIYTMISVHEEEVENAFTAAGVGETINIAKEVQMYKKISVLPANVVYYEDDFPAIKYKDENGNLFTVENEFTQSATDSNLSQSPDQDQEYGKDAAYSENSAMSGGSITKIKINAAGQVAYFDFTGTGFELISRTNAEEAAKFSVQVKALTPDSEGNLIEGTGNVKNIPVITEFDQNGDGEGSEVIYQVPVIRVDDLTYGTYRVYIKGVPTRDYSTSPATILDTYLYIDGLRIFNPLAEITTSTTTDAETGETVENTVVAPGKNEYYNPSESGATFEEIRELIVNGLAAVATFDEETFTLSSGTASWTENRNDVTSDGTTVFEGNKVSSVNDYLAFGPNNEVYMSYESDKTTALVFYVNEVGIGAHNLQIALRTIDPDLFVGNKSTGCTAKISYGVKEGDDFKWMTPTVIKTATEQYYTIEYKNCPYIEGKGYQIVIKLTEGMISYTSLKYNGISIKSMDGNTEGEVPSLIYKNGILMEKSSGEIVEESIYPSFENLTLQFIAKDTVGFEEIEGETEESPILYQIRENNDVRLITRVEGDLSKYSKVYFTLTIDGKTSKNLECATAYSGLFATDSEGETKLYSTKDIYGEDYSDDYFVTFTINNYMKVYSGKTVTITATYELANGEETEVYERTVTIEE